MFVLLVKGKEKRVKIMNKASKEYIDQINREIRKREFLNVAYSFLNDQKRVNENKKKLFELENKLILEKLKNAI